MVITEPIPAAEDVGLTDWLSLCHGFTCGAGVGDVTGVFGGVELGESPLPRQKPTGVFSLSGARAGPRNMFTKSITESMGRLAGSACRPRDLISAL